MDITSRISYYSNNHLNFSITVDNYGDFFRREPMRRTPSKEITAYGIRVLLSRHPNIRKLKRDNIPIMHGNKFWASSWLLMDYFKKNGLIKGSKVMEIGCGWGLAGIYCAKKHNAIVTGTDIDSDVFPFLHLHAELNRVKVNALKKSFDDITIKLLSDTDILIGTDICFWDDMVQRLRRLIKRALRSGTKLILIADPVRSPFEKLGEYCIERLGGEVIDWSINRPRHIQGQILKITNPKPLRP